ncbi:MAG: PAS domain S-box protein [Mycobacterium sp.]|nr:PAS domain S-box protein [Mycobacterium sp.]
MANGGVDALGVAMRRWHRMDRMAAAFLIVLAFAELSPVLPHRPPPVVSWWLGGVAVTVIAAAIWVLVRKQILGRPVEYLSLVLFFVAVQMLRAADGNGDAGFSLLLILAVVWCALYGNWVSMYLAVVGVAAVQFGPLIFVGEPQYPATLWRAGVLWVLILGVVGLAARRLVTALRDKTAALEASEARFRTAFDDAPAGVALVGASGAQHGLYLDVNPAMCALLGRSADELVGRSVLDFTYPDDRGLTERELLAPPNRPFPRQFEKRYVHSSGRAVLALLTYSRIESGPGGEPCFIEHVQDAAVQRVADSHPQRARG